MRYNFIKYHRKIYPIKLLCKVMQVNRSGYYAWLKRKTSRSAIRELLLLERVYRYYEKSRGLYGSPRITREIKRSGLKVNVKTVAGIMRKYNIAAKTVKRFKRTTKQSKSAKFSPNLLKQNFTSSAPDKIWTGDITYIPSSQGWLYLAVVMDLYSRKIVGYSFSKNLSAEIVVEAMKMALVQRTPQEELIFHSDRGSQYTSQLFRGLLETNKITQSMSSTGNCYDNAVTESFFHTLKTELINMKYFLTRDEAKKSIFEFIEVFYNRIRLHSSLNYLSPEEFEGRFINSFNKRVA